MHSYIILGNNQEEISKKVNMICKKLSSKKLIFNIKHISDVRSLSSFTKLSVNKKTSIIINNFENATPEAQSAFLKNLEEPQEKVSFILTSKTIYNILPTISSRCLVVHTKPDLNISKDQKKIFSNFKNMNTSERILFINNIRKKDEAISFIKDLIYATHSSFIKNPSMETASILKNANIAYNNLEANGNVSLQLTNFVVNCDKKYALKNSFEKPSG